MASFGLAACDASSGPPNPILTDSRVLWQVPGEGWLVPAVDDSTVYFGLSSGGVVAVDRRTHRRRWTGQTSVPLSFTSMSPRSGVYLLGNRVVMGAGAYVFAFDRQTGSPAWTFFPTDEVGLGQYGLSTDGQSVFTGSFSGHAAAVSADGHLLWKRRLISDGNSSVFNPAVDEGLVIVGTKTFTSPQVGEVVALDATTGAIVWRTTLGPELPNYDSGSLGGAVFFGDLVIIPNEDGRVMALDRHTGVVRWASAALPAVRRPPVNGIPSPSGDHRPLAKVGSVIVAGSLYETIEGLDASTGRTLWRTEPQLGGAAVGSPGTELEFAL